MPSSGTAKVVLVGFHCRKRLQVRTSCGPFSFMSHRRRLTFGKVARLDSFN